MSVRSATSPAATTARKRAKPSTKPAGSKKDSDANAKLRTGRMVPLFTMTPLWISLAPISANAKLLWKLIRAHVNDKRGDNLAWPGKERLAKMMYLSRGDKINPFLHELEKIEALETIPPEIGRPHNVYVVHDIPPNGYAGPVNIEHWSLLFDADVDVRKKAASERTLAHRRAKRNKLQAGETTELTPNRGLTADEPELTPDSGLTFTPNRGQTLTPISGPELDLPELDEVELPTPPTAPEITVEAEGPDEQVEVEEESPNEVEAEPLVGDLRFKARALLDRILAVEAERLAADGFAALVSVRMPSMSQQSSVVSRIEAAMRRGWTAAQLRYVLGASFKTADDVYAALDWRLKNKVTGKAAPPKPPRQGSGQDPKVPKPPCVIKGCHDGTVTIFCEQGIRSLGKDKLAHCPGCRPEQHQAQMDETASRGIPVETFDDLLRELHRQANPMPSGATS